MEWDGRERRQNMSQDQLERDRLLTEMHADMKHIRRWSEDHDEQDDIRFDATNKKVDWVVRIACMGIGGLGVIQIGLGLLKQ